MFKTLTKINKFYAVVGTVIFVLLIYSVLVVRIIFSAITTSTNIDQELLDAPSPHLNTQNIDKAYNQLFEKQFIGLDLKD